MRRLVKALALTIALLVLITGLAIAVFFSLSDAQHRWIATRLVSALLDSPVEFRGPFSLDLGRPSTFTAKDIWIGVGPDGRSLGAPVEGRLGVVQLRVDPVALLRGTVLIHRLVVESAEIELAPTEQGKTQAGKSWRERLRALERGPVLFLETAQLSEMRVTRRAAPGVPALFLKLQDVSLEKEGGVDGRILLNGAVTVDDHPLALQGEFGSLAAARDPLTPYPSRLAILHPAFAATLEGFIEDPLGARGLDLRARLEVPDLEALDDVIPEWSWPAGRLAIASEVSGSIDVLRLGELMVDFSDPEGRSVKISGEIADALELRGASLDLTARLPQAQAVLDRFFPDTQVPSLDEAVLTTRLVSEEGSWRAEGLDVKVTGDAGWTLVGSGRLALDAGDDDLALESLALELDLSAADTAAFSSLGDRKFASMGPVAATGALSGDRNRLELADLSFRVGDSGRLLFAGTGRVDLTGPFEAMDGMFADRLGVDISAELEGRGEVLAQLLLKRDLPDPGQLSATFKITGSGRQILLVPQAFTFDGASGSALRLGSVDEDTGVTLALGKKLVVSDIRLPLLAAVPGTAALRPWLGDRFLPGLGEMTGRAVLVGDLRDFALHDIVLSEGPESEPRIKASGRIDVKERKQIDLTADFWADLAALVNPFLTVPLQPLGGAKGHLEMSNADGSLGIEMLEVATVEDGDAILRLSGVIDDIGRFAEADFSLDARLARLELIRRAFEPGWDGTDKSAFWQQPASFEGRFLAPEPARFASLEGSGNLGGGGLIVDLRLHDLDARPVINGAVSLSQLNLSDFGIHLRGKSGKPAGTGPKRIFSDTPLGLSRLEGASLDLTIAVDDIIDPLVSMQRIDTRLVWNEKRFALQPTVFVYEGGHVNLVLSSDLTQDPPVHRLLIVSNDMNLGHFLSRFREGKPLVEGKLTVDAGLEARGESAHEIASSVSGDLSLALEDGRLNHVNLRLLAPHTFQWFMAATRGQSYTDLSCVVARFEVAEGVAKSDSLYLRSPRVRLTGAGSIDFGKEELDIVLAAPRPALAPPGLEKPVRFHGSLAKPEVETSATGHAANLGIATAGVVLMPMIFVPWLAASALFSALDEEGEDSPCLIDPEAAKDEDGGTAAAGRWAGTDGGWTLTLTVEGRKARGRIEREEGGTKIAGRVSGKIRSDGVFEGWTLGRQVGGRKIYGRMPELDMWSGETGDAARFTMKAKGPQAEN